MQAALRGEGEADVPCGSCTACCTASQFVHIEPDEADALAHIPRQLLFPAPRLPRGHVLMGEKVLIAERAARWEFAHPTDDDRRCHDALRATAAALLAERGAAPTTALAVRAVELQA